MSPQESISPPKYAGVELIPWDPKSETHCTRLYEQRVACSWDQELIEEWKGKALEGKKYLYWIKISDHLPEKDDLLAKHTERYPKEKEAIVDTATILGNSSRTPTSASFIPIGHIALDVYPDRNEQFSLSQSTIWIKSLYISWAIQAGGFGRSSMHQIERLASLSPLNATTMALDTITKEFQLTPESIAIFNRLRGSELSEARSNEDWYLRQGYQVIARINGMYTYKDDETGVEIAVPLVFLKKDLV